MNKIEFYPVLDLPADIINSIIWKNLPQRLNPDIDQFKLFDFDISDLEQIIRLHVSDVDFNESCSLFGGYVMLIDNKIKLHPQCCGLLEEIRDWKKIINGNDIIYLTESHPSPKILIEGFKLIIDCTYDNEGFIPKTEKYIYLELNDMKVAIENLIEDLNSFSKELDYSLSEKFKVKSVAEKMIWGN